MFISNILAELLSQIPSAKLVFTKLADFISYFTTTQDRLIFDQPFRLEVCTDDMKIQLI